jgi:hypothetical protein
VLKINRHPRRHRSCCEFQWPPSNDTRPHVNTNTQRFEGNMITKTQVTEIRNFFDNYESNMSQLWSEMSFIEHRKDLSDNMTASKSAENLKSDQHQKQSNEDGIAKMFYGQHFPKNQSILSSSTPNLSSPIDGSSRLMPLLRPLHKYFYLPEEKIHSNELVKIRQHFDKSYDKHDSSGISNKSDEVRDDKIAQTKNQITFSEIKGGNISSSLNECAGNFLQTNNSNDDAESLLPPVEAFRISAPSLIKNNNLKLFDSANYEASESDFTQENINYDRKHSCCGRRLQMGVGDETLKGSFNQVERGH